MEQIDAISSLATAVTAIDLRLRRSEIAIQVVRAAVAVLMKEAGWRFPLDVLEKVEQDAAESNKALQDMQVLFDRIAGQNERA